MEKNFVIQKQFPLQERSYTRNGQPAIMAVKTFILSDGIDTIYAEALGDFARALPNYEEGACVCVQLQLSCRDWKAQDGSTRYDNRAQIKAIS